MLTNNIALENCQSFINITILRSSAFESLMIIEMSGIVSVPQKTSILLKETSQYN